MQPSPKEAALPAHSKELAIPVHTKEATIPVHTLRGGGGLTPAREATTTQSKSGHS